MLRGLIIVALAVLPSCVADDEPSELPAHCAEQPPSLELGQGTTEWQPLGECVVMVHGPQGGWHVTGTVRLTNMADIPTLDFEVTDDQTGETIAPLQTFRVKLVPHSDCVGDFSGLIILLDHVPLGGDVPKTRLPGLLSCRRVTLRVCATDAAGRNACTQRSLLLLPDPADVQQGLVSDCQDRSGA